MYAQSMVLGIRRKFQLEILSINVISGIVYFREIILESMRNGSEPGNYPQPPEQLGAAANFDDMVKFDDRCQIRRSQMFLNLAFEFGCDVIFMSHPITWSLGTKLW